MLRKLTVCAQVAVTAPVAFFVYEVARSEEKAFVLSAEQIALYVFAAVVLASPVIAIASIAGAIVCTHFGETIPELRTARGLCAVCEYPRVSADGPCPECGTKPSKSSPRNVSLAIGLAACTLAAVAGGLAAQTWMSRDQASFRAEVLNAARVAGVPVSCRRACWWPNQRFEMWYTPDEDFGIGR